MFKKMLSLLSVRSIFILTIISNSLLFIFISALVVKETNVINKFIYDNKIYQINTARNMIASANKIINVLQDNVRKNTIQEKNAKKNAIALISSLQFENGNYIFVFDDKQYFVHPNINFRNKQYNNYLAVNNTKNNYPYNWTIPKISYIVRNETWNWNIGAGIFQTNNNVSNIIKNNNLLYIIITMWILSTIFFIIMFKFLARFSISDK